jgi:uncharacterized protein (TIGR03435 family)
MRKFVFSLLAASMLAGQTAPTWREFTIGPPTRNQSGFSREGIRAEGVTLKKALARAWGLPEHRVIGPAWIDDERYSITGLVDDPKDFQPLFQQELTARFHMVAHAETKEVPVYVLRAGASGSVHSPPASSAKRTSSGLVVRGSTVKDFAAVLADTLRQPVFDETGIEGKFDMELHWSQASFPSLEATVKQQLGLQLVEDRRTLDLLIIEHIEKLRFP